MPEIEILIAPASAGKSAEVARRALAAGARALVVVPGGEQLRAMRGRLAGGAPRVRTFDGLAASLLRRAGAAPRLLAGAARARLARRLLADLRDAGDLPTYAGVALKPGFVAAAAALLDDLGAAGVAPARLAEVARGPHDRELALLYARYVAFQAARGMADMPRRLALARAALDREPGLLGGVELLAVDGFDQLPRAQLDLLAALARVAPQSLITLTGAPGQRPAHQRFWRTLADLRGALGALRPIVRPLPETADPGPPSAAPLRALEQSLFDLDPPDVPAPAAGDAACIQVIEAPDREREVRAALRHVRALIDGGAAPEAIGLLMRDPQPYATLLDQVAREYGIPLAQRPGVPLSQAPVAAQALALLGVSLEDFPRRALLDLLRSPYLQRGLASLPDPDLLEPVARARGVAGGIDAWQAALDTYAAGAAGPPAPPVTPAQARLLRGQLAELAAWLRAPAPQPAAGHAAWALARLEAFGSDGWGAREEAALRTLRGLIGGIARADALVDGRPQPYDDFLADLRGAVDGARYRPGAAAGALAISALAARGLSFAHVVILGLSEGEFPAPLPEPPIYGRAGRRRLRDAGLDLPTPDPADERTIFYEAAARARETLLLTRTRLDEGGTPLPRSPYLRAVLELLPATPVATLPAGAPPDRDQALTLTELTQAIAHAQGATTHGLLPDDERRLGQLGGLGVWRHAADASAIEAAREGLGDYGAHEGLVAGTLAADLVARRYGPQHRWSATELNNYLTCPFRFAAAHVLALAPPDDPDAGMIDAALRGTIEHAILQAAGERWRDSGLPASAEHQGALLAALDEAAAQVLDDAPARYGVGAAPLWPWEREVIRRRVRRAVASLSAGAPGEWGAFVPYLLEWRFGMERGLPPLRVPLERGDALVQGRIDRVDRREDGALALIDYKSGGAPIRAASLEGRDVQLGIYALAAQQLAPGSEVDRATFVSVGRGERQGELVGPQVRGASEAARHAIGRVVAGVRAGDLRVRPSDTCPPSCAYEAICRRNLRKRDATDPASGEPHG